MSVAGALSTMNAEMVPLWAEGLRPLDGCDGPGEALRFTEAIIMVMNVARASWGVKTKTIELNCGYPNCWSTAW